MMKQSPSYRKSYFVSIVLSFICVAVVGASAWSLKTRPRRQADFQVKNRAEGLQIVSSETVGNNLRLSLRNNYSKNITAYTVSVGNLKMQEDFIYSDRVIAPGTDYTLNIPIPSSGSNTNVLAAVFDDQTSDGDSTLSTAIKERRRGEKIQLTRILPLLQHTLSLPSPVPMEALNNLKSQISSLPEASDHGLSQSFNGGLHNSKEEALRALQKLESTHEMLDQNKLRKGLIGLEQYYRNMMAKLP